MNNNLEGVFYAMDLLEKLVEDVDESTNIKYYNVDKKCYYELRNERLIKFNGFYFEIKFKKILAIEYKYFAYIRDNFNISYEDTNSIVLKLFEKRFNQKIDSIAYFQTIKID